MLKDDKPEVLTIVPAIALEVGHKVGDMHMHGPRLAKTAYAAAMLKDVVPEVLTFLTQDHEGDLERRHAANI